MSYKRASILVNIILYTYDMKVCYMLLCDMSCYATQMMAVTHLSLQNVVDEGHWLMACTSAEVVILTQLLYKCCDKYCLTAILDCFVSFQISLVNQPYFSCAHISQNAHARDEWAGKIRLAKPARVQEPERNVAANLKTVLNVFECRLL